MADTTSTNETPRQNAAADRRGGYAAGNKPADQLKPPPASVVADRQTSARKLPPTADRPSSSSDGSSE